MSYEYDDILCTLCSYQRNRNSFSRSPAPGVITNLVLNTYGLRSKSHPSRSPRNEQG